MKKERPAPLSCAGKGRYQVKRIFAVFLAVVALAFLSALPAVASPPGALPALEVLDLVASIGPVYTIQEPAPIVDAQVSSAIAPYFVSLGRETILYSVMTIAIAAMLAGLMRGALSSGMRLRSDRGIANGYRGSRRWV